MGNALYKLKKRAAAKKVLTHVINSDQHVNVIHYSCESFYDRTDGTSPRITSIAVRNLNTGLTKSFSIHQMAERKKFSKESLEENYDKLEKSMLDEFYEYVRSCSGYLWLHWNMRNINYGFPALAHRHRVLGGKPIELSDDKIIDLSSLLTHIYGSSYVPHPRLHNLIEKNQITKTDFLSGPDEAEAFENKEYVKLHQSTLRKVDIISSLAHRAGGETLKTDADWRDIYGFYPVAISEWMKEHWLITILVTVLGIVGSIVGIISYIFPRS